MIRRESSESYDAELVDSGWLRGVDFYTSEQLTRALARAFAGFHAAHGSYPNLVDPRGFNERIVRSNFLRFMKVPESGNKLLTSSFIPSQMQHKIRCPKILWSGTRLNWGELDQLSAGETYYLKSTHGSGMLRRFTWPLDESEKSELSTVSAQWLRVKFGFSNGEWWYNAFPPMLIIESDVGGNGFSVNCLCFKGKIGLVALHSKETGENIALDGQLGFLSQRNGHSNWRSRFGQETLQEIRGLAGELSRDIEFARFDFLVDDSNMIYLGEVTFSPGNGTSKRPEGFDERLGRMWADSRSERERRSS
jgi:hypothetical protein